jgi:cellobiose phosphorylase
MPLLFETPYGGFTEDGTAYVIKRPNTPKPWVNVIGNPRFGAIISQAGGGFTWVDHSALAVLTRWRMDLVRDNWGKWLYLRDVETGDIWSAAHQPTRAPAESYECRHGLGHTIITQRVEGITSEWTIVVPPDATVELWFLRLRNKSKMDRIIDVCSHFMWCLGASPDNHREFHRLFIDNGFDAKQGMITAGKNLWEVPTERHGHWNTNFPYRGFHACWIPGEGVPVDLVACGDHECFVGRNGTWEAPEWLQDDEPETGGFGRHDDAIAALRTRVKIPAGGEVHLAFAIGSTDPGQEPEDILSPFRDADARDRVVESVVKMWKDRLGQISVKTSDPAFDLLANTWLPYQAIVGRLWGRTGYWQQSGAFGFRDQLQDSQIYLPTHPDDTRKQIRLHARHQFADGTVYHWWHPLSEVGLRTEMTDDLLWLPFILTSYLKETDNWSVLDEKEPFVDDRSEATLWEHSRRAIEKVLTRFSPRGLPLIGAGDWNDGLSACGLHGKGESVWLGHFLFGVLKTWAMIAHRRGESQIADAWLERAANLRDALNTVGWDGEWYWRATLDDGTVLGSRESEEARIFLNVQTWAIINGVADGDRAEQIMNAVEKHLHREYGPLLFVPAFSKPDPRVGYLTRYAPGTRENGGLYTHAGIWGIQAACTMKRPEVAWEMFSRLAPPNRGMDPEHYAVEPYVTPGNVNGPDSPNFGQGGWTWYTGSAAWLRRICLEHIVGVRADWEGLVVDPCLPAHLREVHHTRLFRGDVFEITILNPAGISGAAIEVEVDGQPWPAGKPIPASGSSKQRRVVATYVAAKEPIGS